jgi:hypothetical protein
VIISSEFFPVFQKLVIIWKHEKRRRCKKAEMKRKRGIGGLQLSGEALAYHAQDPKFHP